MLGVVLHQNPKRNSSSWNFGPQIDDTKTVEEIINIGIKLEIVGQVVYKESTLVEAQSLKLNISKAKKELGFNPVWNAEQSIGRTFEWYSNYYQQNLTAKDLIDKDLKTYLNQLEC